jgi:hypothetical protein
MEKQPGDILDVGQATERDPEGIEEIPRPLRARVTIHIHPLLRGRDS